MSRIYEALQKAEAERGGSAADATHSVRDDLGFDLDLERRTVHSAGFPDTLGYSSAVALGDPDLQVVAPDQAPPREHVYSIPSHAPSELPTRVLGLDLEAIPQKSWSPSFDRLPALLDRGPAVEQFRSLRSRIYELRDKRPLKTILVTSGLPQEGKSFVSTNLAISLARNKNARVLLIDGDMRRYTVHQVLGCDPDPGLADYLSSRTPLAQVVQRCNPSLSKGATNGTSVTLPPLTIVSGGNGGDKAADLSNNNRFEELIHTVAPLFDWIIVDSSPVLPVSDAVNLSRFCDGVLLVARSGVTEYENAQRTVAELKSAHLLGFVLNGAPAPLYRGDYYGYSATSGTKEIE
jgi:protein-tyrosine kinase